MHFVVTIAKSFNPYFTGLPILMSENGFDTPPHWGFNPYFTGLPILMAEAKTYPEKNYVVSILILLDYLFL